MQPWDPECFELSSSLYLCSSLQCCKFWPRRYHPSVLITAFILSSPCSLHSYSTVHPPAEWKNVRTRAFASVNTWEGVQQKHPMSIVLFKLMCGSSLSPQTPTNVTHKTYWSSPNIFFPTCFPLSLKRPKKMFIHKPCVYSICIFCILMRNVPISVFIASLFPETLTWIDTHVAASLALMFLLMVLLLPLYWRHIH